MTPLAIAIYMNWINSSIDVVKKRDPIFTYSQLNAILDHSLTRLILRSISLP